MSGRFQGKWPTDSAGNPLIVKIAAYPYNEDSHKMALTRAGRNPNRKDRPEKPLSPLTPDSQIGRIPSNSGICGADITR